MPTLRLALAQVNPTVGDLAGNAALVRGWTRRAADAGAHLVAFPEMMLTGYPVEDLVFRESFVAASRAALERLAADLAADGLGDLPVVVGYLDADGPAAAQRRRRAGPAGRATRWRCCTAARWSPRYFKHHLPNYGVFDEDRYFVPGDTLHRGPDRRRRRRADHLRGPLAGRRPVRRRRGRPASGWSSTSTARRTS